MSIFRQVLDVIYDGMRITFTPDNVADGYDFLIFSAYDSITATFHAKQAPYWAEFDEDEPILLEDCPDSFLESIIKNAK
jgi:hypothetical protein